MKETKQWPRPVEFDLPSLGSVRFRDEISRSGGVHEVKSRIRAHHLLTQAVTDCSSQPRVGHAEQEQYRDSRKQNEIEDFSVRG